MATDIVIASAARTAVASFNGDHVVHFHHPAWRDDRNDPSTVKRGAPTPTLPR